MSFGEVLQPAPDCETSREAAAGAGPFTWKSMPLQSASYHVNQPPMLVHLLPISGAYYFRVSRVYAHFVTAEARWRYVLLVIPNFLRPTPINSEAAKTSREPVGRARRQAV